MRALVIDDEQLVLEGLEAYLQVAMPDLSLDKTADIPTALSLAANVHYELVLLDWHLADQEGRAVDGRAMVRALRARANRLPVLIVSGDERTDWVATVLELGLAGFVPKTSPGATLVKAIHTAVQGQVYFPAGLGQAESVDYSADRPSSAQPSDLRLRYPELTERQAEVFQVMVRGLSDKQIAKELAISESTVKTHVRNILCIVGVHRRGEAVFEVAGRR